MLSAPKLCFCRPPQAGSNHLYHLWVVVSCERCELGAIHTLRYHSWCITTNVLVAMPTLIVLCCYDDHLANGLLTAIRAARSYATATLTQREVCPTTGRKNDSPASGYRDDPTQLTWLPTCTP